jgi:hypothetical protein
MAARPMHNVGVVEKVKSVDGELLLAPSDLNDDDDALTQATKRGRHLAGLPAYKWSSGLIRGLAAAAERALAEVGAKSRADDLRDEYAVMQGALAVRAQLRRLVRGLKPSAEVAESDDFQELLELLWPKGAARRGRSSFGRGSELKGHIRREVMVQLIQESIRDASRQAKQMQTGAQGGSLNQFARMGLEQMARFLARKLRKKKKARQPGEVEELEDLELQELMELFSARALETMRYLREHVAPKWNPEQQPWVIANADSMVYDIVLAGIPEELFAETQAYQEIQDLRRQQAVYTLRAADKLTEATARR